MSTHLAVLARAGLICAERRSQSIIYRAKLDRFTVTRIDVPHTSTYNEKIQSFGRLD